MTQPIIINPILTTNANSGFGVDWGGGFQGVAMPDPATRCALRNGILSTSETLPLWGGLPINEVLGNVLGSTIARATSVSNITGFSVFDQGYAALSSPQSPVPLIYPGGTISFYRLKSGARLWLPCALNIGGPGSSFNSKLSWDFVGMRAVPYAAPYGAATPTSTSYNSTTGVVTLTFASAPAVAAGNWLGLAGYVNSAAVLNGSWQVLSQSSTTVALNFEAYLTITIGDLAAGSPTTTAGGGALPIQGVDAVSLYGDSITVGYDAATGFAYWNRDAIIGSNAILVVV
jgi:hypothetical protein